MKTPSWLLLLPVLALCLVAAAKKEPELTVRFYSEAKAEDNGAFAIPVVIGYPPHRSYISKIPNITEREVQGIYLFAGGDGSLGCSFFLDEHGKVGLETLSIDKRGSLLVAMVDGRHVIDLLIDKRISDGIITIPRGITPDEGRALMKKFRSMKVKVPAPVNAPTPVNAPVPQQ